MHRQPAQISGSRTSFSSRIDHVCSGVFGQDLSIESHDLIDRCFKAC